MKPKEHKVELRYVDKPLVDGMIVRFRNGKHTNGTSPDWQPWQEGVISNVYVRPKLYRDMPEGINYFAIEGADIEFNIDAWDNVHHTCDAEEFILHIPDLDVTLTKRY